MKIRFGSIIIGGSGKINGHCVRNFKGQALLTRLPMPTITARSINIPMRSIIALAWQKWSSLSPADQAAWSALAPSVQAYDRYGQSKNLSPRDLVSMIATNVNLGGFPFPALADFSAVKPTLFFDEFKMYNYAGSIQLSNLQISDSAKVLLYCTKNTTPNVNLKANQLKFISVFDFTAWSSFSLFTAFHDVIGDFTNDQFYTFGFRAVSPSGMVSPMLVFKTLALSSYDGGGGAPT